MKFLFLLLALSLLACQPKGIWAPASPTSSSSSSLSFKATIASVPFHSNTSQVLSSTSFRAFIGSSSSLLKSVSSSSSYETRDPLTDTALKALGE